MQTQTTSAFSRQRSLPPTSASVFTLPTERQRYFIPESNYIWRPPIIEQLEMLMKLETGWDGYQGEPVSFENAIFALKMLEGICPDDAPAPQIVPGTGGDLQIEWHTHAANIELHIIAPNNVHAWIANEQTGPDGQDHTLTIDFTVIARHIRQMMEHSSDPAAAA